MPINWTDWTTATYAGNTPMEWAIALAVFVVAWLALIIVRSVIASRLARLGDRVPRQAHFLKLFSQMVLGTNALLLLLLAAVIASRIIQVSAPRRDLLDTIVKIGFCVQAFLWGLTGVDFWVGRTRELNLERDPARVTVISACGFLVKLSLFVIVGMMILVSMGQEITPLLASVGVASVAIGLALQNILGDLFASLSIVLDRPFVLGDFIIVGSEMGVVERIGLKTTRVRSLSGEQIVFSNGDLLSSRIHNYKKMQERRVAFKFGVLYQTTTEQLRQVPGIVREIIEKIPSEKMPTWETLHTQFGKPAAGATITRFDRAHFVSFGDSSLDFEIVFYVLAADYNLYMDIQQWINLHMVEEFSKIGVEFAYPTRTLFIEKNGSGDIAGEGSERDAAAA